MPGCKRSDPVRAGSYNGWVRLSPHALARFAILAFLLRGAFYCVEQPLWEGFDEWAHFGYVEHLARYGRLPARSEPASGPLQRSLELAPLPAAAVGNSPSLLTHDAWWRVPAEERRRREQELRGLHASGAPPAPGAPPIYEAQQPPLYYLLLAMPYLGVRGAPLVTQVFVLRLASLLIAAAGLWICYRLFRAVPACRRAAAPLVLLLALWPGLAIEESRIANDTLSLAMGATFLLATFRVLRRDAGTRDWLLAGAALGLALLTKGYFLALIPVLPLAAVGRRKNLPQCLAALATAFLIGGWWYLRAWLATGTISGEILDSAAAGYGLAGRLAAIPHINWLRVLDTAATTHIWPGGWSFLNVRAWMYRVFEIPALAGAIGVVLLLRRRYEPRLGVAATSYLLFCLALAYFATLVFLMRHYSMAPGWYLYGIVGVEAGVLASGFTGLAGPRRSAAAVAALAILAAAFDLYTVQFVSIPYYTGIIAHDPSGRLATFHLSALRGARLLDRLAVNKAIGAPWIAALWAGYLGANIAGAAGSAVVLRRASVRRGRPKARRRRPGP